MSERVEFDPVDYESRIRSRGCFICAFLRGDPGSEHELLYDDGSHAG